MFFNLTRSPHTPNIQRSTLPVCRNRQSRGDLTCCLRRVTKR